MVKFGFNKFKLTIFLTNAKNIPKNMALRI